MNHSDTVRKLMQVAHKWAGPDENDSRDDSLEMAIRAVLSQPRGLDAAMRDAAMRAAAQATMLGVEAGRSAFREGKPRHEMQTPFEFIGWDEAEYCAGEER